MRRGQFRLRLNPSSLLAAIILALLCWLPTNVSAAGTSPPTYHIAIVNQLSIGDLVIKLETTKLSDLIKRFPTSALQGHGDAGNAEDWVCYTISTKKGKIRVWPNSGEMGGDDTIIGVAISYAPESSDKNCPSIFTGTVQANLDLGVWLGTYRASIIKQIGPPSRVYGSVISYDFDYALPGPNSRQCKVFGGIDFALKNGHANKIWINKAISC
jgi:hypothetical protein